MRAGRQVKFYGGLTGWDIAVLSSDRQQSAQSVDKVPTVLSIMSWWLPVFWAARRIKINDKTDYISISAFPWTRRVYWVVFIATYVQYLGRDWCWAQVQNLISEKDQQVLNTFSLCRLPGWLNFCNVWCALLCCARRCYFLYINQGNDLKHQGKKVYLLWSEIKIQSFLSNFFKNCHKTEQNRDRLG